MTPRRALWQGFQNEWAPFLLFLPFLTSSDSRVPSVKSLLRQVKLEGLDDDRVQIQGCQEHAEGVRFYLEIFPLSPEIPFWIGWPLSYQTMYHYSRMTPCQKICLTCLLEGLVLFSTSNTRFSRMWVSTALRGHTCNSNNPCPGTGVTEYRGPHVSMLTPSNKYRAMITVSGHTMKGNSFYDNQPQFQSIRNIDGSTCNS